MANSWNLSISCCTRWILREIFISSLFNFRLSSLAHPSGGPERLSTTLPLKFPSLRAELVNGDARQELDTARTARKLLKETMINCAGGGEKEWRRLGESHEVRGFFIYIRIVEIQPDKSTIPVPAVPAARSFDVEPLEVLLKVADHNMPLSFPTRYLSRSQP